MVNFNDDGSRLFGSNSHTGANVVKRSLHSIGTEQRLLDRTASSSSSSSSSASSSSASRARRLKNHFHSKYLKSSPSLFQSTGTYNKNLRAAKRMKAALDNRLKRFRMLDQDEFQEMLKSLSHQTSDEQLKASNGMDTIGGMELASTYSLSKNNFKLTLLLSRLLVTHLKKAALWQYDTLLSFSFSLSLSRALWISICL